MTQAKKKEANFIATHKKTGKVIEADRMFELAPKLGLQASTIEQVLNKKWLHANNWQVTGKAY